MKNYQLFSFKSQEEREDNFASIFCLFRDWPSEFFDSSFSTESAENASKSSEPRERESSGRDIVNTKKPNIAFVLDRAERESERREKSEKDFSPLIVAVSRQVQAQGDRLARPSPLAG